jgi:NTE family protein
MNTRQDETALSLAKALDLSPQVVRALEDAAEPRRIKRGETLIEDGSEADTLYFVLSGRFTVVAGGKPIAEIGSGEPIGEVAFFGGGTRSASVVAARESDILELSRDAYQAALDREPQLSSAIITALARRLRRAIPSAQLMRPRPPHILGIVPGGSGAIDPSAIAPLVSAFEDQGAVVIRTPEEIGTEKTIEEVVFGKDVQQRLVLICEDPNRTPLWADQLFQQCDALVVCVDKRSAQATSPSAFEHRLGESVLQQNLHLLFLRGEGAAIRGTAEDLQGRVFGLHHHMEAKSQKDAARIVRLITGEGLGVVFGGGGAFGTAHLAMLKAMGEVGIEVDMVGGTSVGAAMAGAFAMGLSMDEVIDRFVEMFVTSGAATRYTLPLWSIVDHTHFDAQLKHHYGANLMAEDLPINYFALATSLTQNKPVVLRNGPLWKLIRASSAIPAVFPPLVMDDGEVFVDGGVFDSVPVGAMRQLKAGPNLVLRVTRIENWRVRTDYNLLPGRGKALLHMMVPRRKRGFPFPGITSIMTRSLIANSELLQANVDQAGDVFINLQPIPGMGFMEWTKGRDLFETTYAQTASRLNKLAANHSGIDLLRALKSADQPIERCP